MKPNFSGMDDKELLKVYQASKTQQPEPQGVGGILKKLAPGLGQGMVNAASVMGGGKPIYDQTNSLETRYKEAQINALNNKAQNKGGGYFYMDEEGNVHPVVGAPAGAKPLPAGTTPIGQGQKAAQTEVANSTVPLNEERTKVATGQAEAYGIGNKMMGDMTGQNGQPANVPPGTVGKFGNMTVPLNPPLTETEATKFAAVSGINESVSKIESLIGSGALGSGDLKSAYTGMAVDMGIPAMTYNGKPEAQNQASQLQSEINKLKRDTLFSDAGKALTEVERPVIERLFNVSGKTPERAIADIKNGIQKFNEFIAAKKGGSRGYVPTQQSSNDIDLSNLSDDELKKIVSGQ